jgi:hypothetical protein
MKMKNSYDVIQSIFVQAALIDIVMEQKIKPLGLGFVYTADLRYWFWRYVYMKDLTKKTLIARLQKAGFDNLITVEIIDALNFIRKTVKEFLEDAKGKI